MSSSWSSTVDNCICCGAVVNSKDGFCRQCATPSNLSKVASNSSNENGFISVLGASNAGKTVYLGMLLDVLSKDGGPISGAPKSTFSVNLQEQVITALEGRSFPEKTPSESDMWNWVHCELSLRESRSVRSLDLISPDLAGEALALEVQQPGTNPIIQQVVQRSLGIMILCDSIRVGRGNSGDDLFAMKLAAYVAQHHGLTSNCQSNQQANCGPRLAIVLTKCDACPEAVDDPEGFAANNLPRLHEYCRKTFSHHRYFATRVAGNTAMATDSNNYSYRIPLHIEPKGVVEPLGWLVSGV
jgi:Double-GTPase 2